MSSFDVQRLKSNAASWLANDSRNGPTHSAWVEFLRRIAESIVEEGPARFLEWGSIRQTMYNPQVDNLKHIDFLRAEPDWDSRIQQLLIESPVGSPVVSMHYPTSSGSWLRQIYMLRRYQHEFGRPISDAPLVVEFGGGYGAMCLMAFKEGFQGSYIIIDNEPLSSLEAWYLAEHDIPVHYDAAPSGEKGVYFMPGGNYDSLTGLIASTSGSVFFANWSLSEAPPELQKTTLAWLAASEFESIGIAFQRNFVIDNAPFYLAESAQFLDRYQLTVRPYTLGQEPNEYLAPHRLMTFQRY